MRLGCSPSFIRLMRSVTMPIAFCDSQQQGPARAVNNADLLNNATERHAARPPWRWTVLFSYLLVSSLSLRLGRVMGEQEVHEYVAGKS